MYRLCDHNLKNSFSLEFHSLYLHTVRIKNERTNVNSHWENLEAEKVGDTEGQMKSLVTSNKSKTK